MRSHKNFFDQHRSLKFSHQTREGPAVSSSDSQSLPKGIICDRERNGSFTCILCHRVNLLSLEAVQGHCSGKRHKLALLLEEQSSKKATQANKNGTPPSPQQPERLHLKSDGMFDRKKSEYTMSVKLGSVKTMTFTVQNSSANTVFRFKRWNGMTPSKEFRFLTVAAEEPDLLPNMQLKMTMEMVAENECVHAFKVFVQMEDLARKTTVTVCCNVKISFVTKTAADLGVTGGSYKAPKKRLPKRLYYRRGAAVRGVQLPGLEDRYRLEKDRPLPFFDMPEHLHQFINDGLISKREVSAVHTDELSTYKKAADEAEVTFMNYKTRFTFLLYLEEHQTDVDIECYFMERATLHKCSPGTLLSLEVPGLAENRPSILRGDEIFVTRYRGPDSYGPKEYQGFVHAVQQTRVFLGFHKELVESIQHGMEFGVRFVNNRLAMRIQHRALSLLEPDESNLENLLFPTEDTARAQGSLLPADTTFQFYARAPELNPEQERAVSHIVRGTSRPAPYIVFGPPGTGKTFTIVEAIKQVLKMIPKAMILVCTPSNSSADLITERLLNHIQKRHIYRLNAVSRSNSSIPEKIKGVCNLDNHGETIFPSKQELADKDVKIYITTLITAGRLVSASFDHDHFTHIFVDEASQATEPETISALAGVLYLGETDSTEKQVVLAGDPKQLGPILRSPFAKKYKLDVSLIERLMECTLYRRWSSPDQHGLFYDPYVITKLVRNYRSHPAILKVPNQLFYDGELEACGKPELTHLMCGWDKLADKKKEKPVIFHAVIGEDMQEANSPSFFNPVEINHVMKYVDMLVNEKSPRGVKITEDHIGIITPYSRQVQKIRGELRKRDLEKLKVGSVEEFQGQERLIIIVSTVRSDPRFLTTDSKFSIGFLQNNKRFNVAVTRAKALLIVIGNPNILRYNTSWDRFVEYCKENDCMIGGHLDSGDNDESIRRLVELLKMMDVNSDVTENSNASENDLAQVSAYNNEQVFRRDQ